MISINRIINVSNGKSKINEPIIVYRGDYELEVRFTIINKTFNFIETENAAYGQLAILTPYGGNIFSPIIECNEGTVSLLLSEDMLDQIEEVGLYSFQIRLFDQDKQSRISIPPVEYGIEVREPIASEDHDNTVNNAIVGYSIAKIVNPAGEIVGDTFDINGQYNKTDWKTSDRITKGKLNKIEDALDKLNQNEKADVAALDKRITSNYNVLESIKADKTELDVERSRIDSLTRLPSGSTSGDAELIDARIDIFGKTHTNVGTAIRENFRPIFMDNEVTNVCAITTNIVQNGGIISIPYNTTTQELITVTIIDTDEILNMNNNNIIVGIQKTDGTYVDGLGFPGKSGGVCDIDLDYPIKYVRVWFDSSSVKGAGNVTIKVSSSGINKKVCNHEMKIKQLYDRDISVSQSVSITTSQAPMMYKIPITIPANTPITITLESPDDAINPMTNGYAVAGILNESGGYVNDLAVFSYGNSVTFQINQNVKAVNVWFKTTSIKKDGELTINIQARSIAFAAEDVMRQMDNLRENTNDRVTFIEDSLHVKDNINYGVYEFNRTTSGQYSAENILRYDYKAGTPIYITYKTNGNNTSRKLTFGCNYVNLGYLSSQFGVELGETVVFTPSDDITSFVIWSNNVDPGSYMVSIDSTDRYSRINDLQETIDESKGLRKVVGYSKGVTYAKYTVKNTTEQQITKSNILAYDYKKDEPLYITFSCNNPSAHSTTLFFGCHYVNLGYKKSQVKVELNATVEFIPQDDITEFTIWAETASADTFIIETHSTKEISLCDRVEALENKVVGYNKGVTYAKYTVENTTEQQISINNILAYDYKKDKPLYITFSCNNPSAHSTVMKFGCHYVNLGYKNSEFEVELNTTVEFIPQDDITKFAIWTQMSSADTFIIETHSTNEISLCDRVEALENKINGEITPLGVGGYKSFSIVGDSYSTFKDWLPEGNSIWYPPTGGNASNDVRKVQETWWWQLADRTGMTLFLNDSWSGSTICGTGYNGGNVLDKSAMVTRVKTHMGQTKVLGPKPDVIFLFGGTNDSWAGSPIGSLKYSDWTEDDLMQVLPAFCSMVDYLKTWNPGCRIINITNSGLKADITTGLATACEHYGIENIQLTGVDKIAGHPSVAGMKAIADQIINIL